ncbi:MAG: hypothetical protein OEZ58_16035 [Gammaproteobacteria bacterium]|nr:hypothetical protein [Gammaproteobacteria bacterium]MDH5730503.1 hypothetical protein [Gammaproteobacteria bacterium]
MRIHLCKPSINWDRWLPFSQFPTVFVLVVLSLFGSACSIGFHDGQRVTDRNSTIYLSGYITQSGSSGADVRVKAFNVNTNTWDTVARSSIDGSVASSVSFTMADGTELYSWTAGNKVLPAQYWQAGVGGYFARVRAEWYNGSGSKVASLLYPRNDWGQCFFENYDGQKNTLSYITGNCFSHRSEAYIYTQNYREGSLFCPAPGGALSKTNGHYMLNEIPSCARSIINTHMRERIDASIIDDHYEIEHNYGPYAHEKETVTRFGNDYSLGGFFGGHERYLRKMERHVMVYDYPWMPKGKIPSWAPHTSIPWQFQTAVASSGGNCDSQSAGCNGWLSGSVADTTPNVATPANIQGASLCTATTTSQLHSRTNGWHGDVHFAVGNNFYSFDSPSFPLFYLWHNYVEDIWLNWKRCGHAGP